MKPYEEQLISYRAYHQNAKNRFTHFFGIPLVVLSIYLLLTTVTFPVGERTLSLAWIGLMVFTVYYLVVDFTRGLVIALYSIICVVGGQALYREQEPTFWRLVVASFILGWALQFLGHYFEGKRPAFFANLLHLLNGPLFVAEEVVQWVKSKIS